MGLPGYAPVARGRAPSTDVDRNACRRAKVSPRQALDSCHRKPVTAQGLSGEERAWTWSRCRRRQPLLQDAATCDVRYTVDGFLQSAVKACDWRALARLRDRGCSHRRRWNFAALSHAILSAFTPMSLAEPCGREPSLFCGLHGPPRVEIACGRDTPVIFFASTLAPGFSGGGRSEVDCLRRGQAPNCRYLPFQ
jgi:hypothetical protein